MEQSVSKFKQIAFSIIRMGSTFSIIFITLIGLLALQISAFFLPETLNSDAYRNLVTLVMLAALTELLYLNINKDKKPLNVSINEELFLDSIIQEARNGDVKEVKMISSGLSSRYRFIAGLIESRVNVMIIVQGKKNAVDQMDFQRIPSMITSIDLSTKEKTAHYLQVRGSVSITSFRAIVVNYKNDRVKVAVSWYTYDKDNNVLGHTNPVIFLGDDTDEGNILCSFAREKFDTGWLDSVDNTIYPMKGSSE